MMKKFARFICAALVLALLLTSCSSQSSTSAALDPQKTIFGGDMLETVPMADGIYYTDDTYSGSTLSYLMYYDFAAKTSVPLCSNPQCTHEDENMCNAIFKSGPEGLMYNKEKNCLQGASALKSKVYSINLDGSGREEIGDLSLVAADGKSVHYSGTYMMNNDNMFYSNRQKDGSIALYMLPLRKNAAPQKLYASAAETVGGDTGNNVIYVLAVCGESVFFCERSYASASDGANAEDIGRSLYVYTLKYYNAATDEICDIAEGYFNVAPYGDKYLIAGMAGLAVWDPSAGTVEKMALPEQAAATFERAGAIHRLYYDDGSYYMVFFENEEDADGIVVLSQQITILVLDEQLQLKSTIQGKCPGVLRGITWNDEYLIAVGYNKGEAIYMLPKSEIENQTEITWDFENVLK